MGVVSNHGHEAQSNRWPWAGLAAIILVSCTLAVAQSYATRLQWGPDEPGHIIYIRSLAMDLRFPSLTHREEDNAYRPGAAQTHEAHQPPLYYALAGLVWRAFAEWPDKVVVYRDKTSDEMHSFAAPGPVRPVRFLSVFLGAIALIFVWAAARTVFPERPELWLSTTALVGFTPMFTYLNGVINNDALLALVFAAIGWQWARAIRFGAGLREALMGGLLLGIALNVKETAVGFAPITLLVFAVTSEAKSWRGRLVNMGVALGTGVALGGWWFARKWAIYGTPFIYPYSYPLLGLGPEERALMMVALPRQIFLFSVLPYDVVKDYVNIALIIRFFGILAALSGGGFALALIRRSRRPMPRWETVTLLVWLAAGAVVVAGLARNVFFVDWRMGTSGGRYLVAMLPLMAPVAVRGLWALFGQGRGAKISLCLMLTLLLLVNLYVIWGTAAEYGTLGHKHDTQFFTRIETLRSASTYEDMSNKKRCVVKSNNILQNKVEPNGVAMTLINGEDIEVGNMKRIDSNNLVREQVKATQSLLEEMDRTATVFARRRERLNMVIRARKARQQVAWNGASRERRLHG